MFSNQYSVFIKSVLVTTLASLMSVSSLAQEKPAEATIPESEITALREDLAQATKASSSVEIRRACKGVIRGVQALLESAPDAPNRYTALELLFEGQKRLLTLEATESNRAAIYETCSQFRDAPDEYAETRFDADMILSEKELADADATVAERTEALNEMLARYRGTAAEWKSLLVGSLIATKLLDFDLEKEISDTMLERFAGDYKVIEFRRKKNMGGQIDAVFSGSYKSQDGRTLVFPFDRMGHQYVLDFWSETAPNLEEHFAAIKELQAKYPGRFKVYSFNVDELPDAGEEKLRKMGLDWTAMHLPGGKGSLTFRAYARATPNAVFVNGQGHVLLVAPPKSVNTHGVGEIRQGVLGGWNLPGIAKTMDDERYLAQLRSLFIGDFLVAGRQDDGGPTGQDLRTIQSCFTEAPFRYRLSQKDALANYRRAEKLCSAAIKKHAKAEGVWAVRNRRIIALIGMASLAAEPKYLADAVQEAERVLGMELPEGADVAARFCLAKSELRSGGDPETLARDLIEKTGGEKAPLSALAAAAVITLEANGRTAHNEYRRRLLEVKDADVEPALWSVYAFLRDKHHRYRNFWATPGGYSFGRPQKYKFRDTVGGLEMPEDRARRIRCEMTKLDGGKFMLPEAAGGKMHGVLFVEPTADASSHSNLIRSVNSFVKIFTNRGVQASIVFLSDDTNSVGALAKDLNDGVQVGMLPGGLGNPLVRELGILSADRVPNPLLFRPDGTVAWTISGLDYRHFYSGPGYAISLAIETNIQKVRSDVAFETLARGDYDSALKQFSEYMPGDGGRGQISKRDWWTSDRHQGMALAYIGLRDWDRALTAIDAALEQRKADFKSAICKCHGLVEMYLTKAMILDGLDRGREAKIERTKAAQESLPHSKLPPGGARQGVPIGVYYDHLKQVRLELAGAEGGK